MEPPHPAQGPVLWAPVSLSRRGSILLSHAATAGPWRVSSLLENRCSRGRKSVPPSRNSISPQLPTLRLTATQLTLEGPFSSQGLSSQSPDAFIWGALLGKVLCQCHLQATLPPHHTHATQCHPACPSVHSEHSRHRARHWDTHKVSVLMQFPLQEERWIIKSRWIQ